MKYLVVYEATYWSAGYNDRDPGYSVAYETVKYFETKEKLEEYLVFNHGKKTYADVVKHVFEVRELVPNYTVSCGL